MGSNQADAGLITFVALLSGALVTHYLATSALLARNHIVTANLVELVNVALVPVAAMYLVRNIDARSLLGIQTAAMGGLSAAVLAVLGWRLQAAAGGHGLRLRPDYLAENAAYGLPRAAGLVLETGFLVIGPWLLRNDLAAVGYLTIAFFMLRFARTVVQPVTILIGMRLGGLHSRGAQHDVSRGLNLVVAGVLLSVAAILPPVHAWSSFILQVWLGSRLAGAVETYALPLLVAVIPLSLLQALKEPIEIMWKAPFVLGLYVIGSMILVCSDLLLNRHVGAASAISYAYVVAYTAMSVGALLVVRRNISSYRQFGMTRLALLAASVWAVNYLVAEGTRAAPLWSRALMMLIVGVLSALLLVALYLFVAPAPLARDLRNYLLALRVHPGARS